MTVYADLAFAVNAIIDYLLLALTARLGGAPLRRGRVALAAAGGGLFAVGALAVPALRLWPVKLAVLVGMLALSFGFGRRLLRQGGLFCLLALALAGLTAAVASMVDAPLVLLGKTACYPLRFPALVMTAGLWYLTADFLLQRTVRHAGGQIVPVRIEAGQKAAELTALRDSGNTLCDPLDNTQVLVVQWQALKPLLPARFCQDWCDEPVQAFETLVCLSPEMRWRLIACRTVGAKSMLLGFKADAVRLGQTQAGRMTVALSPTPVSDGGGYMGLLGGTQ